MRIRAGNIAAVGESWGFVRSDRRHRRTGNTLDNSINRSVSTADRMILMISQSDSERRNVLFYERGPLCLCSLFQSCVLNEWEEKGRTINFSNSHPFLYFSFYENRARRTT